MNQWYKSNGKLFSEEREEIASTCPLMRLVVVGPGFKINSVLSLRREGVVAHGIFNLKIPDSCREIEYRIVLVFPENYPKRPPDMFCDDPKLPIGNIDRHIMSDGRACLGVQAEIGMRWRVCSNVSDFLETLVAPFLAWQAYYDVYQKPPSWGERSHHKKGILEFYAELLGTSVDATVIDFMRLLARKNNPKGHEYCPCGSGERLRNCHRELIYAMRERVSWKDVKQDLEFLQRDDDIKRSTQNYKNRVLQILFHLFLIIFS